MKGRGSGRVGEIAGGRMGRGWIEGWWIRPGQTFWQKSAKFSLVPPD